MLIGEYIKQYRTEHNLSLRDFAAKTSLSHSYIALLEKNEDPRSGKDVVPSIPTIKEIAKATHMDFMELFELLNSNQSFVINNINHEKTQDEKFIDLMTRAEKDKNLKMVFEKTGDLSDKSLDKLSKLIDIIYEEDKPDDYGA